MTLKVKVNDPYFFIPALISQDGANLVIPVQICDKLSRGQGKVYTPSAWWSSVHENRTSLGHDELTSFKSKSRHSKVKLNAM